MEKYARHNGKEGKNSLQMERNKSVSKADREAEQLIKDHIEFIETKKSIDVQALRGTDFQVTFVSEYATKNQITKHSNVELSLFKNMELMDSQLLNNITALQYQYMTPIQKVVIPFLLQGKDVMACSETGSGKTVAYLFPIISNILKDKSLASSKQSSDTAYPLTVVLVPTRELADQVSKESKKLCFLTGLNTVAIYGGSSYDRQILALSNGCDILVGTPGRITDFLKKGKINLSSSKTIIIDEADRMLDMGFGDQLKVIINDFQMVPKDKRQNIMFSATFNPEVEAIGKKILNDHYNIRPTTSIPKKINQELILAENSEKNEKLCDCLKALSGSAIIFLDTKKGVDSLMEFLSLKKFNVVSIHGDKSQYERQNAIKGFSRGTTQILIATDVASRGLDFPNVKYIFNYDLPRNFDDYIHRIGRTGRMGQEGTAISLINESNRSIFDQLYSFMKSQNQPIPKWFLTMNLNQKRGQENRSRSNRFSNNSQSKDSFNREKSYNNNKCVSSNNSNYSERSRSRSNNQKSFKKRY